MRKFSFLLGILWVLLSVEMAWAAGQSGLVTMHFDLTAQPAGEEVRLWIPYPVSDPDQLISDVKVSGDYHRCAVYTEPAHGNPILFASWDQGAKSRKLTFSFQARRQEVQRRSFPSRETCWDPADYQAYLKATRLGPVTGEVKKLADNHQRAELGPGQSQGHL